MLKQFIISLSFLLVLAFKANAPLQQDYKVTNGSISFRSDAPLELIKAQSNELKGLFIPDKKQFAFIINIKSFKGFNSPLQQEHFNENYLESNKFPVASFEGKIIEEPPIEEKITTVKKHLQKSIEWKGNTLGILEMRPHYSNYLKGLPNIKPYRTRLVMTNDISEIYSILDEVLNEYSGIELIS